MAVKRELSKIVDTLDAEFDADSKASVIGKLADMVKKTVSDNADAVHREVGRLVDPSNPDGPGGRLRAELIGQVKPILEPVNKVGEAVALREAVAEEADKGTAKGSSYEELVGAALEAIGLSSGDTVENVGAIQGVSGTKVGDHTVTVAIGGRSGRIAIEDKDQKTFSRRKLNKQAQNPRRPTALCTASASAYAWLCAALV